MDESVAVVGHHLEWGRPMRDVVVLIVAVSFFALCVSYVRWCDRIIGPDPSPADEATDEPAAAEASRDEQELVR